MPIYDYECPKRKLIERNVLQPSAMVDKFCPNCTARMHRIPVRTSFILKGDGWTKPRTGGER